jgi:AraC-like DNA-binding protein
MGNADAACRYVHSGRLRAPRGRVFRPHAHPCHECVIPLRGRVRARIGGTSAEAGPGDLLWYPEHQEHFESVAPRGDGEWFYVQFLAPQRGLDWPLLLADRDGAARQLVGLITAAAGASDPASQRKRDALATALCAEIERLHLSSTAPGDDGMIAEISSYMQRHLANDLGLEHLAHVAGMSRAHFARAYRERSGRTPMAALRDLRLAAARELLLTTDLPLHDIAPRVGIGSEHLLSRLLVRHLGVGARALRLGRRQVGYT